MLKYKIIVSDADGTLLNKKREISQRTKDLIKKYMEYGGIFTLATGRMEISAKKYMDLLELKDLVILYNGSKLVDLKNDITVYEKKLELNIAKKALEVLQEYKFNVFVYLNKNIYVNEINDVVETYMEKDGVTCKSVGNLFQFLSEAPTKILIIGDESKFEDLIFKVNIAISGEINSVHSEKKYLEILPEGVSKGEALRQMANFYNIPLSQVIAIGDDLNDLSMIKAAGLGVVMKNGNPLLFKEADYITESNENDGVGEVIRFVLEEGGYKYNE